MSTNYLLYAYFQINSVNDVLLYVFLTGFVASLVIFFLNRGKNMAVRIVSLVIAVVMAIGVGGNLINRLPKFYDQNGELYRENSDVVFYDAQGEKYGYRFEEKGYDVLFDEEGNAYDNDLCFLDENSILHYDKTMDITVSGRKECVDLEGNVYYPVKKVSFDENGKMSCEAIDPFYDRTGKAYSYRNVPFYNTDQQKYYFSIASGETEGVFTNLATGETIGGKTAFVDEDGYLFDLDGEDLMKYPGGKYEDKNGKAYYRATAVQWDGNGHLEYIGLD